MSALTFANISSSDFESLLFIFMTVGVFVGCLALAGMVNELWRRKHGQDD